MAHTDVVLQGVLYNIGFPLIVLLIIAKISQKWVRYCFAAFNAAILTRVGKRYTRRMHKYKAELFADMSEDADKSGRPLRILDVGSGAGSNFKYFPANSDVICVEPNDKFESYLRKSVAENSSHTHLKEFIVGYAEDMATIPSDSIDAAVCTLVLCNVDDIDQSLSEIKRVLKTVCVNPIEYRCCNIQTHAHLICKLNICEVDIGNQWQCSITIWHLRFHSFLEYLGA